MFFGYLCSFYWFGALGSVHVEILHMVLIMYLLGALALYGAIASLSDLRRFFVFSELVWLVLFTILLSVGSISSGQAMFAQAMFILVFTACEAVILASILLLSSESGGADGASYSAV